MKNHEIIFINLDHYMDHFCKIYICKKCNYELYAYPDDNYVKLYFINNNDIVEILSCEEMIIKTLLE